jgi:MFS family permease
VTSSGSTGFDVMQGHPRRWPILGVMVFSLLIVVLDNSVLNVALRSIQQELQASQSQLEWAVNSYTLVFAGLLFTWGVLGDRYGRRLILVIGMISFGITSALCAHAATANQLIGYRALMGVAGASVLPVTLAIVTNVFPPAERGRAIGVWAGSTGLGVALGPIVGGLLLEHFWWGSVFLINVPIAIVAVVAIAALVPESKDAHPSKIDPLGVLLSLVGVITLVFGIIRGGNLNDWWNIQVIGPIVLGIVLLAIFALFERRSSHPSLDVTLFRDARFSASTAAITLAFFALFGAVFFLSFYLQYVKDYSPLQAGLRLIPTALGLVIFAPLSERGVRLWGARFVVAVGLCIVALSFFGNQLIEVETPYWHLAILQAMLGMGMGLTVAPATTSFMSALPRDKAGTGSAVTNAFRQIGGALGVAILGSVIASVYRTNISSSLSSLPPELQKTAGESLGSTLQVVGAAPELENPDLIVNTALHAYVDALHAGTLVAAVAALCGAAVAFKWLPKKGANPVPEAGVSHGADFA